MSSTKVHSLDCVVFEGLCNRINAMASALVIQDEINLYWAVNKHCPVECGDLFNIPATWRVFDLNSSHFPYSRDAERVNWFYLCNPSGIGRDEFVEKVKQTYRQIVGLLKHQPTYSLPEDSIGVCYRYHLPKENRQGYDEFIRCVEDLIREKEPSTIFVASDHPRSKEVICRRLKDKGLSVYTVDCELLRCDMDRSVDNLLGLSEELVLLSQCTFGIVANTDRSTVADSARGFNVPVFRPQPNGKYKKRNSKLEKWLNESILPENRQVRP